MNRNDESLASHELKSGVVKSQEKDGEEADRSVDIHLQRVCAQPAMDQEKDVHSIVDHLRSGPNQRGELRRL